MSKPFVQVVSELKANPAYSSLSEEAIIALAEQMSKPSEKKVVTGNTPDLLNISSLFTKKEEVKLAKELVNKYLADYNIETESDKNLLRQLIYLEVLQALHLQRNVNEAKDSDKGQINSYILDSLHKNLNEIIALKEKLGLTKDSKKEGGNDVYTVLDKLKAKFKVWLEENQGSRTLSCPHCGKMTLLRIRMNQWEALDHPFFKDRILTNSELISLYKEGLAFSKELSKHENHEITVKEGKLCCKTCSCPLEAPIVLKSRFAKVLDTSTDYIDWMLSKIKPEKEENLENNTNNDTI